MDKDLQDTLQLIVGQLGEITTGQKELKKDVLELKDGQHNIMLILENEIRPSIRSVAEGHKLLNQKLDTLNGKLDKLENKNDRLEIRVVALENSH